jgi:hypothetical protein
MANYDSKDSGQSVFDKLYGLTVPHSQAKKAGPRESKEDTSRAQEDSLLHHCSNNPLKLSNYDSLNACVEKTDGERTETINED